MIYRFGHFYNWHKTQKWKRKKKYRNNATGTHISIQVSLQLLLEENWVVTTSPQKLSGSWLNRERSWISTFAMCQSTNRACNDLMMRREVGKIHQFSPSLSMQISIRRSDFSSWFRLGSPLHYLPLLLSMWCKGVGPNQQTIRLLRTDNLQTSSMTSKWSQWMNRSDQNQACTSIAYL